MKDEPEENGRNIFQHKIIRKIKTEHKGMPTYRYGLFVL